MSTSKENSRDKVIRETTKVSEHRCTPECIKPYRRPAPKNIRKVSLGYIYESDEGFFIRMGDGDWLPVEGMTFVRRHGGGLVKMFEPAVKLMIHSPGGRTIIRSARQKEIKADAAYHARTAAGKLKKRRFNLKEARDYLGREAAEVIPKAARRSRPSKGVGRGARGQPRTQLSVEVIRLRDGGLSRLTKSWHT